MAVYFIRLSCDFWSLHPFSAIAAYHRTVVGWVNQEFRWKEKYDGTGRTDWSCKVLYVEVLRTKSNRKRLNVNGWRLNTARVNHEILTRLAQRWLLKFLALRWRGHASFPVTDAVRCMTQGPLFGEQEQPSVIFMHDKYVIYEVSKQLPEVLHLKSPQKI